MEVVNPRAALLSNYEVLSLLRELESDHLARTKTAIRVKKEEEASGVASSGLQTLEISENLRTVEVEAIQYLASDYLPTSTQTPTGITKLVKDLASYELTKAEKLQIVNLAPVLPVELYVIVEELEDRLGDQMEEILSKVQLMTRATAKTGGDIEEIAHEENVAWEDGVLYEDYDADAIGEEVVFDDTGEGVGVEGDLDMDDD